MTAPEPQRLYVPNAWQMTVKIAQSGQPSACVFGGLVKVGNPSFADGQAWLNACVALLKEAGTGTMTVTGGVLRSVSDSTPVVYEYNAPVSPSGVRTGTAAIAAAALVVKWATATGGRSGKGRTFLPGIPSDFVQSDGRGVTNSAVTTLTPAIAAYIGTSANIVPAILSFTKGQGYPITAGSLSGTIGVQRRRMRA